MTKPATEARRSLIPPLSATTVASLLMIADSLVIILAGLITYDRVVVYSPAQNIYTTAVVFVWLVTLSIMNFGKLYQYNAAFRPIHHAHMFFVVIVTAFLFLLAAAFSIDTSSDLSRKWVFAFAATSLVGITGLRLAVSLALKRLQTLEASKRNVAILGNGEQLSRLSSILVAESKRPLNVQGTYPLNLCEDQRVAMDDPEIERLMRAARSGLIDDVFIAVPWSREDCIMNAISKLRELPVNVFLVSDLVGFRTEFRSPPGHFSGLPLWQVIGKPMSGWDAIIKTVEDYVLGIVILILAAPLMALIAVGIWLDSGRPILFRQKRLGFNNQVFDVYKFRTMRPSAEPQGITRQAKKNDDRVTRFGRFLRKSSLDELPQIFNVLNGTMSVVGPRPHALDHNEDFAKRTEGYFARHRVKPGITGLAQVKGFRGETDTIEKLEGRVRNDNFYAENWSPSLDIWILVRTAIITITGKNAY
jgi:putative colanic acid biosysnthesis UDP-glucose lipid carrier transferase